MDKHISSFSWYSINKPNIYPLNIYFHGLGVVGWTIAGFVSKDKAILTNFGLQIPLFLVGIYKIII